MQKLVELWITAPWTDCLMVAVSSLLGYFLVLILTRWFGLRTFAKMSSFDFVTTVAMGSILAATVLTRSPQVTPAIVALVTLYSLVHLTAWARHRWPSVSNVIDNQPILLMDGESILHENLTRVRVSVPELKAKLREANVLHFGQVRAVVMETTGDISVLHGPVDGPQLDRELLEGVRS